MRAARPRLAVLLLHACSCVLVEGFALRAAKDPRRGVIQQLFGSSWSGPNILKPLRPSMTKRKETLLRGKIAAKRSFVDQINREIEALDDRSCVVTGLERKAHETRMAILRVYHLSQVPKPHDGGLRCCVGGRSYGLRASVG